MKNSIRTALTRRTLGFGLVALALAALLGALIVKTRSVDFEAHNAIVATLRQLKQVDAEWNVDVLRSRTGLNSNYDPVASPLPLIASLEEALRSRNDQVWSGHEASRARLIALLDAHKQTMDAKIVLIERFKSSNAILRNSSRFLPVAVSDLIEAGRATATPTQAERIEQSLNDLLLRTMTYVQSPDADLRESVERDARLIQQLTAAMGAGVRERGQTLVDHVNTVLRQQLASNKLLADLAALPTAQAIDALSDAHAQEREALLAGQQVYRNVLIGYSGILLALVAYLGWRLYRNFSLLNQAHSALKKSTQELKDSQAHLVQSEKMSALGQMVAGIAHEINTPLAYVKGTIDVMREQLGAVRDLAQRSYDFTQQLRRNQRDTSAVTARFHSVETVAREVVEGGTLDDMRKLLSDGVHGIDQIAEIVVNLKNFSRLDRAKVSEFSVNSGLDSTLLLAKNLLKNRVEVRKEYAADLPSITCSPSQINQVFLNIISNAAHAMPAGAAGVITLRTAREGADSVRVEIQDNGSGIPKDVLPKIFDPFFTTKPIGQGTGMGLSISYKIIQEHGGRIGVDTEEGVGTVFSIVLPIAAVEAHAAAVEDTEWVAA